MISFPHSLRLISLLGELLLERWVSFSTGAHHQIFIDSDGQVTLSLSLQAGEIQENPDPTVHYLLCDIVQETANYPENWTIDQKIDWECDEMNSYDLTSFISAFSALLDKQESICVSFVPPILSDYRRS